MARIQPCRNGCDTNIVLQQDNGKWKPYEIDEQGDPLNIHNCPKSPYNLNKQQQQGFQQQPKQSTQWTQQNRYNTSTETPKDVPKYSQGGPALDTKRLLQAVVELTKEFREWREEIKTSVVMIDTGRYENQMKVIYEVMAPLLGTQTKTAAELYKDTNDPAFINHAKKADDYQNFMQSKKATKFVDESREKIPLDQRIPEDKDEFALQQSLKGDDEEEGVIDEDL